MLITTLQSTSWRLQMSHFVRNTKTFSLLSNTTKTSTKYFCLSDWNLRNTSYILSLFLLEKWQSIIKSCGCSSNTTAHSSFPACILYYILSPHRAVKHQQSLTSSFQRLVLLQTGDLCGRRAALYTQSRVGRGQAVLHVQGVSCGRDPVWQLQTGDGEGRRIGGLALVVWAARRRHRGAFLQVHIQTCRDTETSGVTPNTRNTRRVSKQPC